MGQQNVDLWGVLFDLGRIDQQIEASKKTIFEMEARRSLLVDDGVAMLDAAGAAGEPLYLFGPDQSTWLYCEEDFTRIKGRPSVEFKAPARAEAPDPIVQSFELPVEDVALVDSEVA